MTVGFCDVLQQTPRAVTLAPPAEVTRPPQVAVVADMLLTLFVVTVGFVISGAATVTVLPSIHPLLHTAVIVYWQSVANGLLSV